MPEAEGAGAGPVLCAIACAVLFGQALMLAVVAAIAWNNRPGPWSDQDPGQDPWRRHAGVPGLCRGVDAA